jgi:sugar phosphate permease
MRYTLLAFLCAITVIAYVQRSAMNGATKAIEGDLHITSQMLGLVMSAWYLLYSLFQLPGGWVADRLGSKAALVLFAVLWSLLTGLAGLATGLPGLLLLWALMGAAQAGVFPCCTKAIGAVFPRTQQAFASGALACCMSLGGALAPAITAELLGPLSWQAIFALYAAPGLAWAVVFALVVPRPDSPAAKPSQETPGEDDAEDDWHALPPSPAPSAAPARWTKIITDPQMLLLCFQQFLRAGANVFYYTWFARFLQETKGLTTQAAGSLASWPPLVGAFGGLLGGLISDWVLRRTGNQRLARQGITFIALCLCTGIAAAAYFTEDPRLAVVLLSISAFCAMASGVSAYALAIAYGGKRVATVFATMNMSGNLGATLFPLAVAWLVATTGTWNSALALYVALFGIAALCWVILNPRGTLFDEPEEPK